MDYLGACNWCGKDFDEWDEQQNIRIHKRVGYGSDYDGAVIDIRLCCSCLDKIIGGCAIPPIVEDSPWE